MWEKEIIRRECEWDSIDGKYFDCVRYISCIFYALPKEGDKPYLTYGSYGACIGGGSGKPSDIIWSLNSCLKKGQAPVTIEEVESEVQKFIEEINKDHTFCKRDTQ